jgi:sialic acid synthase SpsE
VQLVLDCGSGNGRGNEWAYQKELIDAIKSVDTGKHDIVLKYQLFQSAPPNVPLKPYIFMKAHEYGSSLGYKVTASVFDKQSLNFLLRLDPCFVKIACRPDLYCLIGEVPRKTNVFVSKDIRIKPFPSFGLPRILYLQCIPEYPAHFEDYNDKYPYISDHTEGWDIYNKYKPDLLEKHIVIERSPDNPDSGSFAILPADLKEIM